MKLLIAGLGVVVGNILHPPLNVKELAVIVELAERSVHKWLIQN